MKVIYNNIIPFKGFKCVNLLGVLFVRKGCIMREEDYNHEAIYTAQMKEMLFVFFYLWYMVEWVYYLIRYRDMKKAYYCVSFEREAYLFQSDSDYLEHRKRYQQYQLKNYGSNK